MKMAAKKLGWLTIESTSRAGCDISPSIQQFFLKRDANAAAAEMRADRRSDDCYSVEVRRETKEDSEKYGSYVWAG